MRSSWVLLYWVWNWVKRWTCPPVSSVCAEVLLALVDAGGCLGRMPIFFSLCISFSPYSFFSHPKTVLGTRHKGWIISSMYCSDNATCQLQFPGLSHKASSLARNNFLNIPFLGVFQGSFRSTSSRRGKIYRKSRSSLFRNITTPQGIPASTKGAAS